MKKVSLVLFVLWSTFCPPCHAQLITTYAGDGTHGYSGDGGPAIAAQLFSPMGLAEDTLGNLYIADRGNYRIRKVDMGGTITTIAGTGVQGYSGDGGPATDANIDIPMAMTIDRYGNIYYVESTIEIIRKITPGGIISTVAGTGAGTGYSGDGGPATDASISCDLGITVDTAGNVYFSDQGNHVVRKIDAAGIITTFAGNGTFGFSGDGGPATAAQLKGPNGLATDRAGNVYIADGGNGRARMVNTSSIITTYAGNGLGGYSGDGGPATAAGITNVSTLATDTAGNLYITDHQSYVVRKVDAAGIIHTLAGTGVQGYTGDGGPATAAMLYLPYGGLTTSSAGVVYITDGGLGRRIRVVDHPPHFAAGHVYTITACADTPYIALDTLLAVLDTNTSQYLRWMAAVTPLHGTLAATDTMRATPGTTYPAGLRYTPSSAAYFGADSFRVLISDGIFKDSVTIHVALTNCSLGITKPNNSTGFINIYPNPADGGRFTVYMSSPTDEPAAITITDATGIKVTELHTTTNKHTSVTLDTGSGIYHVTITTPTGRWTKTITHH